MEYTMIIKLNDVDLRLLIFKDVYSILLHRKILCMKISVLDLKKTLEDYIPIC